MVKQAQKYRVEFNRKDKGIGLILLDFKDKPEL